MAHKSGHPQQARVVDRLVEGGVISLWVEHPDSPDYRFRLTYTSSGQLVGFEYSDRRTVSSPKAILPSDLPLEPEGWSPPPAVVTVRRLRAVPFGEIDAAARQNVIQTLGRAEEEALGPEPIGRTTTSDRVTAAFADNRRPGRRGRDDRDYLQLAVRYIDLLGGGNPIVALSDELQISRTTIRNLVGEARRRGLLTHPPRGSTGEPGGRAGGELTDKGRALLEVQRRQDTET